MRLLGIDVDGVVVDTLTLYKQASHHLEDPLDFWRDEGLYDDLVPMVDDLEDNLSKFEAHKRIHFGQGEYKDWNMFDVPKFCKEYL